MNEAKLQAPGLGGFAADERRIIRLALLASVVLHVLLGLATWRIKLVPDASELRRAPEREVELILVPDPGAADTADEAAAPDTYTAVPERQASPVAPDDPKYLALHHSIAADTKVGDSDRPSADEEGEFEQVDIRREQLEAAGGVAYTTAPLPAASPEATVGRQGEDEGGDEKSRGESQTPQGEWAQSPDRTRAGSEAETDGPDRETTETQVFEDWVGAQTSPSILKQGEQGAVGDRGFEFDQRSTGAITSGVAIVDDLHLSTVAWNWAPWVQEFSNRLQRNWVPPYAYRLGLLTGTTVVRIVVEKDGRPSSMKVLETDGHESLHDASVAALKSFVPYNRLPVDFPEENLVITLSLHYPALRR